MQFTVEPIGHVRSSRAQARDDGWDAETASIILTDQYEPEALRGLDEFSHVEVVYVFDQVQPESIERGVRRPRGRSDLPEIGIFAQRGRNRPNRLGLTTCAIVGVDGVSCACTASTRSTGRRCSTSSRGWPSSPRAASDGSRRGRPS